MKTISTLALLGGLLTMTPAVAEAGFSMHGSAGSAWIVAGDVGSSRTPMTLELAPGWSWKYLRLELPVVLAVADKGAFPSAPHTFMGLRPSAKIFPLSWLYGRVGTQIYFGDSESERVFFGATVGAGAEIVFFDTVALNAEVNVNPFFTPKTAVPIELRAGVTLLF